MIKSNLLYVFNFYTFIMNHQQHEQSGLKLNLWDIKK